MSEPSLYHMAQDPAGPKEATEARCRPMKNYASSDYIHELF